MPFMETVFQASARHSSYLPVHLIRGSVGGEFFFLFFLALASSCVKKPGLDAAAMEPDVIMSCITPSFSDGIPWEESGPWHRAGEMPSCIAASYTGGDGVNLDMPGT
jgi:hypothetical protein